MSDCTVLG